MTTKEELANEREELGKELEELQILSRRLQNRFKVLVSENLDLEESLEGI